MNLTHENLEIDNSNYKRISERLSGCYDQEFCVRERKYKI